MSWYLPITNFKPCTTVSSTVQYIFTDGSDVNQVRNYLIQNKIKINDTNYLEKNRSILQTKRILTTKLVL